MAKRDRIDNLWWKRGLEHPMKGVVRRKPESERAPKQTYANYLKEYFNTESGRESVRRSRKKYRDRLRAKWGCGWAKAAKLEAEEKRRIHGGL